MKSSLRKHSRKVKASYAVHHSQQKNKSKKHRHRNASVSYSDSDWRGSSSLSISSSSSDDSYRARRMTRARDHAKRTSKRSRRSSSSSSEGRVSVHRHHKKKGEFKQSTKLDKRNKPLKKKRKNAHSPGSDLSRSCSTCGDLSSSGVDDSKIESSRSVVHKVNIRGRSSRRENMRKRMYHSRSRSSSSCSGCSGGSHGQSGERLVEESFPRRLESVITVFRDSESSQGKDEDKADIIPAHDDCPSRSNDSYEGVRKRDNEPQHLDCSGQYTLEKVRPANEEIKYKDGAAGAQPGHRDPPFSEKNNSVSETHDLEHLLRQKALENFKRFRNGLVCSKPRGVEKVGDGVLRELAVESSQIRDLKSDMESWDGRLALGNHGHIRSGHAFESKTDVNHQPSGCVANNSAEDNNFISTSSKSIKNSLTPRPDSVCNMSIHHQMPSGKPEQDAVNIATTAHLNENQHSRKEGFALDESSKKQSEKLSGTKDVLLEKVARVSSATATPRNMQGMEVKKGDASGSLLSPCPELQVADHASTETVAEEVKDGSQYEQKTMSVMRGGEMVQVSYKVYIPKKPPALGRRQLRR